MFVSVIVPTYKRNESLRQTISSILGQRFPDYELIVVDQTDQHDKETEAFLLRYQLQLRLISIQPQGLPHARNVGVQAASGDIIIFCDDDVILEPEWIHYHAINYVDPAIGAVGGRILERGQQPVDMTNNSYINSFGRPIGNFASSRQSLIKTVRGGNMSFRRSALDKVGYFDVNFRGTAVLEESDLCYRLLRAGYRIVYEPRAGLLHLPQPDGNVAIRNASRIQWYSDYFHNGMLFTLKNKPKATIAPFVIAQIAIAMKQGILIQRSPKGMFQMLYGLLEGFRTALG